MCRTVGRGNQIGSRVQMGFYTEHGNNLFSGFEFYQKIGPCSLMMYDEMTRR